MIMIMNYLTNVRLIVTQTYKKSLKYKEIYILYRQMSNYISNLPLDLQNIIMDKKIQLEISDEYKRRLFDYENSTIKELKSGIITKFKEFCNEDFICLHFSYLTHKYDYVRVARQIKAKVNSQRLEKMENKIRIDNEKLFKKLNKKSK
jgi:hypothetical protein